MALSARKTDFEHFYTADEFEKMPEFEDRYELVDGKLVKKDVPGYEHGHIAKIIQRKLTLFDPEEKLGEMVQEVSTKLGKKDVPLPDLSFWAIENKPKLTSGAAPKPDLAVEVLSPHDLASKKRREDVLNKVRRYQAAGVRIVWVINPRAKTVEVYHPGQLAPVKTLRMNDQLDGEDVIPNFSIPIIDLFA
jgi:Uma2 family endonuclease